jgi:hypothetical protein
MANRWNPWKTFRKGVFPAIGAYFAAHAAGLDVAQALTNPGGHLAELVTLGLAGLIPALINLWKTKDVPGNPFYIGRFGAVVVMVGLLALGGAGCATTHPDGSVTRIDVETTAAIATLSLEVMREGSAVLGDFKERREELEAARRRGDINEVARILSDLEQGLNDRGLTLVPPPPR